MKEVIEDKGRVRPVVEGDFQCDKNGNSTRFYEILSIVGLVNGNTKISYISKKDVPIGIPITDENYWYSFQVISVPKGDKGDKGDDGVTPIFRISADGQSIEISTDNGETWSLFERNFNKLRVLGYVNNINLLPKNAIVGDIYGVWNQEAQEGVGAYELYINTIKDWLLDYTITKVYDYDTELPSSATDGTTVLVPVTDLTLDKEKVDGYKVYKYNLANNGWVMILNTAEIYANKEDIVNKGDNVYALVQGATEGTYELYKRSVGWVYFGTNASITYYLIQNVSEGTATNVPSGKAVKDATEIINTKIQLLASGIKVTLNASPSTIYKNVATNVTLTGRMEKATPSEIQLLDGSTVLKTTTTSPITHILSLNTNENIKAYQVKGTVNEVVFDNSVTIQARYPIYYGFGANAASVAVDANRLAPTTSAAATYTKTNNTDDQHFYILVPSDITDVNNFTMGGAPFVMNSVTTQTIGDVIYKVHESGNTYNADVTLKVSATV